MTELRRVVRDITSRPFEIFVANSLKITILYNESYKPPRVTMTLRDWLRSVNPMYIEVEPATLEDIVSPEYLIVFGPS